MISVMPPKIIHEDDIDRIKNTQGRIVSFGRIEMENNAYYEGSWMDGQRWGKGTQKWSDGSIYIGEWKSNKANGEGILYHADGDVY
jgi:hypothetical protein